MLVDFLSVSTHNVALMSQELLSCTGDCNQCSGIHIEVPADPSNDLHLIQMHARFANRTKVSARSEEPGSIYVRGSLEELQSWSGDIQKIAADMGFKMHACLDDAAHSKG